MAKSVRKSRVREVPLAELKDDLSRFLREAETGAIVIARHGTPAGALVWRRAARSTRALGGRDAVL